MRVPAQVEAREQDMDQDCAPYPRKTLYWVLTLPMMVMYVAIAVILWQANVLVFAIYCALFPMLALGQSYACVYWQCPYVGRFAPCAGGFCLPSSRIALLLKNVKRSAWAYNLAVTVAFLALMGIVFLPVPFLYQQALVYLLAYLGIVVVYAAAFLWWICPVCATRQVCPGGQAATKLRQVITGK
jgi:hypothetical protein